MSVKIQVFVGFKSPVFEDFRKEMETFLGISFRFVPDEISRSKTHHYYVFSDEHKSITLLKAGEGFEDFGNLNFSAYHYYIGVRAIGWRYEEEHDKILNESSRSIFEKLKATGRYPLMMTYDVQRKLDEFQPRSSEITNN